MVLLCVRNEFLEIGGWQMLLATNTKGASATNATGAKSIVAF